APATAVSAQGRRCDVFTGPMLHQSPTAQCDAQSQRARRRRPSDPLPREGSLAEVLRIAQELAIPPVPRRLAVGAVGERVTIEDGAHERRRLLRKRILRKQRRHRGGRFEEPQQQRIEVRGTWRAAEQQEPELEIHAWLVWGDERRRAARVTRLV